MTFFSKPSTWVDDGKLAPVSDREKKLIEAMRAIHELKPDKSGTFDPFTAFYLTVKRLAGSALIDAGEKVECENTSIG